ncbi:MAG TPA: serine hydrolase [Candidatus Tumulicola sp.]|nr:serine hydrolase [Candidatus Tumulicola sp.]HSC32371.1 serine hydrolase [Gemmatimonadaceae bacterium]
MVLALLAAAAIAAGNGGLPVKAPASVGMSAARLRVIDRVVLRGIHAGGFPGAAVVVGRKGAVVWEKGFGRIDWKSSSPRVSPSETLYDLASLTKVVGTTTAIMILYDKGLFKLDDPVVKYLPEFGGGEKDSVTIRELLEHRSGLPADRELWRLASTPEEARHIVLSTPLDYKPGAQYVYSDLGAMTLGFLVEKLSGQPLDEFLEMWVFHPLGMMNTFYRPADSVKYRAAPTEDTPPRGYPLKGEVHDENAYALGGVAGHAGLFSTAADLSIFAQMILNGGEFNGTRIVADSTIRLFTHRAAGSRALGWAMADGQWGSGRYLSDEAFGHVGYTGTSLWIDPDRDMFVILLTNRVHEPRARRPEKVIADVRADLSDAAAVAVTDDPDQLIAMPVSFRADKAKGWNHVEHRHHRRVRRRGTKSTVRITKHHTVTSSHSKKAVATPKKNHTTKK